MMPSTKHWIPQFTLFIMEISPNTVVNPYKFIFKHGKLYTNTQGTSQTNMLVYAGNGVHHVESTNEERFMYNYKWLDN